MSATEDSTVPRPLPQLGLMARRPVPGRVKTRLVPPLDATGAARLYEAFLEDMLRLGGPDWRRTVLWTGEEDAGARLPTPGGWTSIRQAEGDLGARLEAAFTELGAHGSPIVLVGSDHPDLPGEILQDALRELAVKDVVIGPAPDGGYYLIGLREPVPGLLHGIAWSTPAACEQTVAAATSRGLRVGALTEWPDVDTWRDVEALAARLGKNPDAAPATSAILSELGLTARER